MLFSLEKVNVKPQTQFLTVSEYTIIPTVAVTVKYRDLISFRGTLVGKTRVFYKGEMKKIKPTFHFSNKASNVKFSFILKLYFKNLGSK